MASHHFGRFTELHDRVQRNIGKYLLKRKEEAKIDIETTFKKEKFIFTQDNTFKGLLHLARAEETAREAKAAEFQEPCKNLSRFYNYLSNAVLQLCDQINSLALVRPQRKVIQIMHQKP